MLANLELLIQQGKSPEVAGDTMVAMGLSKADIESVLAYRKSIADALRNRTLDDEGALYDPELAGEAWYTGVNEYDIFWPRLRDHLERKPGWAEAVPGLDETSRDVVSLLHNPHRPVISTRGLVVGYVQSGKTANFTATIAKAADAGYRLFIVLSGVHNSLRRQTQIRLTEELHDLEPTRWLSLTTEKRDFGNPVKALALVAGTQLRLLAVVKKNASRLKKLHEWLDQANRAGGFDTCPILIIDDEADQASPNASADAIANRSKINEWIVKILGMPRVSYVGYTATPFANVLIDPKCPHDLYPRHFIYSLPKPEGYFGAAELFGLGRTEEEEGGDGHDVVRLVPEEEARLYAAKAGEPFQAVLTPSLEESIRWFCLATAARRARGQENSHSSMLIHTSSRVAPHFGYEPLVKDFVKKTLRKRVEAGDLAALRDQWESEVLREPAINHALRPVAFDELAPLLGSVLDDIEVAVDNGSSPNRLLYDPAAASTVIAIGGNTLSRGLTLEGLVTSFFLRGSNTYDALLQMGRWFGYRRGYADLPRIWTTKSLMNDFRFLAGVEEEIRRDIDRYSTENAKPSEVAVRIRLHPKLQVTSKLKMQFAVPNSLSFSGQRPQTVKFNHRDPVALTENLAATRELLARSIDGGSVVEQNAANPERVIIRDVNVGHVLNFVRSYHFHDRSEMSSGMLAGYIEKQVAHGNLIDWNIAVMTKAQPTKGSIDLGLGFEVPLIERSALAEASDDYETDIGALMSRPDRVIDLVDPAATKGQSDSALLQLRNQNGRALLLIYPIAKSSEPRRLPNPGRKPRRALDALTDIIGVAVSFPTAAKETEPTSTVSVDLSRIAAEPAETEEFVEDFVAQDEDGDQDDVSLDSHV